MTGARQWERDLDAVIREVAGFGVPPEESFFQAGLTSALVVAVHQRVVSQFGADVPVTVFFKYPSRRALGAFLASDRSTVDNVPGVAGGGARGWSAQDRRDLRSRLRQRKG